ncbi:putative linoleate 9S-lipoxygenase 5 [Nicotiana tabacum]|uniref:Linoleate 9S-lipoxygenase 5 n=3 Tax=Nicotiana TaxID=4085 RepID=A0AC58UQW8_TOBAC|nr:PREDICTED: probable linoleate 9S-lipoxygenase 5 isoform X2 [Nicotiana sylvestris]
MASTDKREIKMINGTVLLMKKTPLDLGSSQLLAPHETYEILGHKVILQLVSSVHGDQGKTLKGELGNPSHLRDENKSGSESKFCVIFEWDHEVLGAPGAFIIKNLNTSEFYLKSLTLEASDPSQDTVQFVCNSWVYPAEKYKSDRIFFVNQAWLPSETPAALRVYREEELLLLRGNGTGKLQEWDRVYDYDCYNDLGDPDNGPLYARPVLGGSVEYPYPRRGRTGRPPSKADPNSESRLPQIASFAIYVPRDEKFSPLKMTDVLSNSQKAIAQVFAPQLASLGNLSLNEFNSFDDVLKVYEPGTPGFLKYPTPHVIREEKSAWMSDEEFGRETLAGLNPVCITGLKEFPLTSKLDPKTFGDQTSKITREQIQNQLDGMTIEQAMEVNRLFMLNYHDIVMPYARKVNTSHSKIYASRTVLFLQKDGTLKPLAIELSLPHPDGDQLGAISKVFTPAENGVEGALWQIAKAFVAINDSGVHQLLSHWLRTHASVEPFVIAANRQLSVLHPVYKLLHPHFRDTMHINALARQAVLNAGGIVEKTVFPGPLSMELTSIAYRDWVFPDQALPAELVKRGVAVEDPSSKHGVRLLIEDYPYAVDGLEIWSAIKSWVQEYICLYYKSDDMLQVDTELQAWWKELREVGHGDKKDEPWWPKMQTRQELIDSVTIIIWMASALHAAVNFGQYPYGGFAPNRPGMSRRLIPEPGTPEYEELKVNPVKGYLKTITPQFQTLIGISALEVLSTHTSDEIYLGQRDSAEWTKDKEALQAFERFGKKLAEIEENITKMNNDKKWKNRTGPVKMPYTLLYPTSEPGLTAKGIPNSISI